MIRKEKNHVINSIVRNCCIPAWLKDLDPILAGGSVLYFYLMFGDENSFASKKVMAKIKMVDRFSTNKEIRKYLLNKSDGITDYPGDVDVWFASEEALASAMASVPSSNAIKTSNWANTFLLRNRVFPRMRSLQVVKKVQESPESLIESFDLANCMIAWRDDTLYIDDRLDAAFASGALEYVNNPYEGDLTFASKLYNAIRLFKYADRYSLSFSDEIHSIILSLFLEADDADLKEYAEKTSFQNIHYGKVYASENTVRSMMQNLAYSISIWYGMKNFREENLAFLIGLKSKELLVAQEFVKSAFGEGASSPGW